MRVLAGNELMRMYENYSCIDHNECKYKLYYTALCYVVSRCVALRCVVLCCVVLRCVALCCVVLHCVVLRCVTLHYITLRYVTLRCVTLRCATLRYVVLRCTILHYIDCYRQRENIKKIIHTLKRLEEQSTSNEVFVLDHIDQMAMRD